MRIVVFCPNPIGDAVMATPALRALRAGFPDATIDAVLRPVIVPTLAGAAWIDARIPFDPRSKTKEHRTLAVVRRLRQERYDLALLLPNSFRTALLAWMGGARRRVGYDRGGRGRLLTDTLPPVLDAQGRYLPTPAVDAYLKLVRLLNCPIDSNRLELFTTPEERQLAAAVWSDLGLPDNGSVVCLNTGGAFGPAKAWPIEHFAALARRFVLEADRDVLVLCGPSERDEARAIVAQARHPRVRSLAEHPPSIGLSKASLQRAALLVTTDSGPRHLATALGVPVVALFGPTFIAWTRTNHPQGLNLQLPVPCGPCQKAVCPEGHHRCMRELTPESVFAASMRLLGIRSAGPWRAGPHVRAERRATMAGPRLASPGSD